MPESLTKNYCIDEFYVMISTVLALFTIIRSCLFIKMICVTKVDLFLHNSRYVIVMEFLFKW